MAKILMINVPYSGHTNPTLPLTRELVQRGHLVDYINAPEWREEIEETGAGFIPYIGYPEDLSERQKKARCFQAAYKTAIAVGSQYDLLVYEMFFYPGKTLAERLNIPCVRQFSLPALNKASVEYSKKNTFMWELNLKIVEMNIVNKSSAKEMNIVGKHLGESVISEIPELNIVYVTSLFQPCRDTFDERYIFVGPAIVSSTKNNITIPFISSAIASAMKNNITIPYEKMRKPIIYISMGSMISSKVFCRRCIRAFGDKDVTVILTTGKRVMPESLGKLPDNFFAYSFVPQLEVLQHADLFITHGGMNSVNEAMYYGVPMLVMPILSDQPVNALQVERLQIGKRMRAFPITANRLYRKAMEVLQNKKFKENAIAMQKIVRSDVGARGAAEKIELFMNEKYAEMKMDVLQKN